MILRNFKKEDAPIIAEWLRSEEELYKWSADRFNKYPLTGEDINENYAPQIESGRFYPLTAVDENETIVGHFIIRYPRDDDDSSVRFGFVIVNPAIGVATVAAEAGHAQPSTTLMIYTQQYKKRQESIRNQLSRELYGT